MAGSAKKYQKAAWFAAAFMLVFSLNLNAIRSKGWTAPDPPGDTETYCNIAMCLASGKGFARDYDDPVWRAIYEKANASGAYNEVLSAKQTGTSAYTPPAVPLLMAIVYALSKEYFFLAWRLVDSAAVSLAAGAATVLARRMAGVTAAATVLVLCGWDFCFFFTPSVMTEGFATLAIMLLVYAFSLVMEKRIILVALAGVATGLLILVRSFFALWLPALPLLILAYWQLRDKGRLSQAVPIAALYLAVTLATVAPWWARNCIVTGRFMPLGTQGGTALPGGYSDLCVELRGNWAQQAIRRIWASYSQANDVTRLTLLETELTRGDLGQREAVRWMKEHWATLPRFALRKAVTEWRAWQSRRILVLFGLLMLGSLLNWRRHPQAIVLWFVIVANTLVVMATYAMYGRYLIPVLLPCYMLIGVGITEWLGAIQLLDDYLGGLGRNNRIPEGATPA
jgi:hypothetical protein